MQLYHDKIKLKRFNDRGFQQYKITNKNTIEAAKNYFDCNNLDGVELATLTYDIDGHLKRAMYFGKYLNNII